MSYKVVFELKSFDNDIEYDNIILYDIPLPKDGEFIKISIDHNTIKTFQVINKIGTNITQERRNNHPEVYWMYVAEYRYRLKEII